MGESRDAVIKLFGKTIQLPAVREALVAVSSEEKVSPVILQAPSNKQENNEPKHKNEDDRTDEQNISVTNEEKTNPNTSTTEKNSKAKDQQNKKSNNPMDKTLKKPDKILPCPRCKSMETKFCYFNNYNVSQPRHFCKNCQRYWTEGGSIRNVPVGAGRRKSKSSATNHHYHHITIPDCAQADFCESISHLSSLKHNGTVLSFGADARLCESMDPNGEDQLSRTLVTTLNSNDEGNKELNSNCHGLLPYLNGPNPWSHQPPFYPMTPYWGMPWLCSGLNSTILGKHSREENMLNHSNSEDDHEKAAKCSVWATLGFKNRSTEASQVLFANPAALSRSLSFQERS